MIRNKILVIDDDKLIRWGLNQKLSEWNLAVFEAEDGAGGLKAIEEELPDLILLDVNLPDFLGTELLPKIRKDWPDVPVIMITAYGTVDGAVEAMRFGAYDFIVKPIDYVKLKGVLTNALEMASLKDTVAYYKQKEEKEFDLDGIIAESAVMKKVLNLIRTVARSEVSAILLQGDSGTGKDILAQAVHHLSRRKSKPFMVINCSAIPDNLLESELFGYEKGAFTDAKERKKGLAEIAHGGTLFLDEIGTLISPLQAKLLRFLETQTFKRIGGLKDICVDVRVISATNQNLEQSVAAGDFRKDLFYRLNVCPVYIPPLRERRDDILPLARFFIELFNQKLRKKIKGLKRDTEAAFLDYDWPGNIRELRNVIERAMIFEEQELLSKTHLPLKTGLLSGSGLLDEQAVFGMENTTLDGMEKKMILHSLQKAEGNKSLAARRLGITRDTLRYKLKKHALTDEDYR